MMNEAWLIVNPAAGGEEGERYADLTQKKLETMYDTVKIWMTEKGGDATRFANKAAKKKINAVFVIGGDGTVNEGISGIAEEAYRPDFGFIPLGTVNDLGRVLGISLNPEEAIQQLPATIKKKMDVGKVNNRYFIDTIAIGSIPEAVHDVDPEQKTKLGPLAYFLEGAKALGENKSYTFDLVVDDEKIVQESILVIVALANSVGGFEALIPNAEVDDGFIHLMILKGNTYLDKLKLIPKIFTGAATDTDEVLYRKFKSGLIDVQEQENVTSNIDGDRGDQLPLDIKVLESHITVFAPEAAEGQAQS